MGRRWQSVVEHGTLWVFETNKNEPRLCDTRMQATFEEILSAETQALAEAMSMSVADLEQERFTGNRRCFVLKVSDRIATYGWVSHGAEAVGELERTFQLRETDAYIWDCVTLPDYRGMRCYSTFLSHVMDQLHQEGTPRIWIGASQQNVPSVKGFVNAGFSHVLDLTYRRLGPLTLLWFSRINRATPHLVNAAYQILVNPHERQIGPLAIGYKS